MRSRRLNFRLIKSNKSYLSLLLGAFLVFLFTTCKKDDDNFFEERRVQGKISFLDVIDARALILGGDNGNLKSTGLATENPGNSIFKITEDGVVQEITYWQVDTIYTETEDGMKIVVDSVEIQNTIYPARIFNVDNNYLIVCFVQLEEGENFSDYYSIDDMTRLDYLVRKSDGAMFELPLGYGPQTRWSVGYNTMFKNEESSVIIQQDESGNIYYLGKGDVIKLNTQNLDDITFQQLTTGGESGEGVMNYRVNGSGHIIFNSGGITAPLVSRFRFSNGGLAYPEKNVVPFWLGFDNNFYFSYGRPYSLVESMMPVVEKATINNGEVSYIEIGEIEHPQAEMVHIGNTSLIFRLDEINKIVVVEPDFIAEVYNSNSEIKAFSTSDLGITNINIGICSDNYYYLSGLNGNQPVLLKVNPSVYPHQAQHLVPQGSYDVYKMTVGSDDYVMIHALRMSDGNNVISQISPTGEVTIMEDIGTDVIQLIQIN